MKIDAIVNKMMVSTLIATTEVTQLRSIGKGIDKVSVAPGDEDHQKPKINRSYIKMNSEQQIKQHDDLFVSIIDQAMIVPFH